MKKIIEVYIIIINKGRFKIEPITIQLKYKGTIMATEKKMKIWNVECLMIPDYYVYQIKLVRLSKNKQKEVLPIVERD